MSLGLKEFKSPFSRRRPVSEATKAKLRAANLGKKQSPETIAKRAASHRGKKRSPEIRAKFSLIQREIAQNAISVNGYRINPEQRRAIAETLRGRKQSESANAKRRAWVESNRDKCRPSDAHLKKLSALFKGKKKAARGVRNPRNARREDPDHKDWRNAVFDRDDYTCQDCRKRGVKLNAHHIKGWAEFPELRYDVSNGITYCVPCHAKHDPHCRKFQGKPIQLKEVA